MTGPIIKDSQARMFQLSLYAIDANKKYTGYFASHTLVCVKWGGLFLAVGSTTYAINKASRHAQ